MKLSKLQTFINFVHVLATATVYFGTILVYR